MMKSIGDFPFFLWGSERWEGLRYSPVKMSLSSEHIPESMIFTFHRMSSPSMYSLDYILEYIYLE